MEGNAGGARQSAGVETDGACRTRSLATAQHAPAKTIPSSYPPTHHPSISCHDGIVSRNGKSRCASPDDHEVSPLFRSTAACSVLWDGDEGHFEDEVVVGVV